MVDSKIGEVRKNNKGTDMKIIAYRKHSDIDVEFLDEHHYVKRHSTYTNFVKGEIKNPFDKITFGVGYLGTDDGIWEYCGDCFRGENYKHGKAIPYV